MGDLVMDSNAIIVAIETEEQLASHSLEDVVLPLPGNSIRYPNIPTLMREVEQFVSALFGPTLSTNEIIGLENFGATCKMGKLAGAYRRLVSKPVDLSYDFVAYSTPDETVLPSLLENKPAFEDEEELQQEKKPKFSFLGLRLDFSLSSSCYATMALREVTRSDTSSSAQKALCHQ